ncbi:hypothetical protein EV426DRAFT_507584, partial [Tirmania nivea]
PIAFKSTVKPRTQYYFGQMSVICPNCTAMHWLAERSTIHPSTLVNPQFSTCCNRGDVLIPPMRALPPLLQALFYDRTSLAIHFRTHIRKYNSALAFVSLKYQADQRTQGGLQCFQVHGALYHMTGPLHHAMNMRPQFAQLFLYDP